MPPRGTAVTTLTADPAKSSDGRYGGRLTATSADGRRRLTVAVGAVREPGRHTVTGIDRRGVPFG
ncbi:hypothetical protein [Actinomadura sp. HBU206391]|uniref:hypothetical protein n=1 Tax=Actinomadura sp. HBU206391 TaxID=2731692 RepID=UPI001650AAD9|nr:hypothetical protein [Actinomadura sp. HBU206391]MBC6459976.1 hypothetical protein [Actinomadura sp. HBU206391]